MKIELDLLIPNPYSDVEKLKDVILNEKVKAYSLNKNFIVVEGEGSIENDGCYNYHNNYDNSEDVMVFNGEHRWFSLSKAKVIELQEKNITSALLTLKNITNTLKSILSDNEK